MSRVLELSDEEYARLEQVASEQGSTVAELVRAWISGMSATPTEQSIREIQARWAASGASTQPTEDELRAHPLLQGAGIVRIGTPGRPVAFDDPWQGFYGAFESEYPDLSDRHDYDIGQESLHPDSQH